MFHVICTEFDKVGHAIVDWNVYTYNVTFISIVLKIVLVVDNLTLSKFKINPK